MRGRTIAIAVAACAAPIAIAAACGSSSEDATPGVDASVDAAQDAATDAAWPMLPYPSGPYGTGIGDVFPDFRMLGYRLSRTQRDSTKLPFEDIWLSQVRSDPTCDCLVVVYSALGTGCGPCVTEDSTFATAIVRDPHLCAMEFVDVNYDTTGGPQLLDASDSPPTRADLDVFTQNGREPFPVGMSVADTRTTLATPGLAVIPDAWVVRPSDMRVLGYLPGTGGDLGASARAICGAPHAAPRTIASGFDPRRIVLDGDQLFASDGTGSIVRVPAAGGATTILARRASTPDAIAVDATNVYWATHEGATSFEIAQAPKNGGAAVVLDSGTSGYRDLVVDGTYVYFTRDDGAVAKAPIGGGAPAQVLYSTEAHPTSIAADDTTLYWVARDVGSVVSGAKDGSSRKTLVAAGALSVPNLPADAAITILPVQVFVDGGAVFIGATASTLGSDLTIAVYRVTLPEGEPELVNETPPSTPVSFDPMKRLLNGNVDPFTSFAMIGRIQFDNVFEPTHTANYEALLPGQPFVTSVTADTATIYFTTHESDAGGEGGAIRSFVP